MDKPNYEYWARLEHWYWPQCVCLAEGMDPPTTFYLETVGDFADWAIKMFGFDYTPNLDNLRDWLLSALSTGALKSITKTQGVSGSIVAIRPHDFLLWLDQKKIKYPLELGEALRNFGANSASTPDHRHEELLQEIDKLKTELQKAEKSPHTKTLNNFRKLILGMAIKGFAYNPRATRSEAIAEIVNDLRAINLQVSDTWIREQLKESVEHFYDNDVHALAFPKSE